MSRCFLLVLIPLLLYSLFLALPSLLPFPSQTNKTIISSRVQNLYSTANRSILVHLHIPKVGGSALSLALATECDCKPHKHFQLMVSLISHLLLIYDTYRNYLPLFMLIVS